MDKKIEEIIDESYAKIEQRKKELEDAYNRGVEAGIKQMMDKIQKHCELGKPVMANGELYWLKDARQNLIDIMDDIDAEYGIEREKKYIVPMRRVVDGKCEEIEVIISAKTPYEAWCGAIYNFGEESGWLVFSEYDKYEQLQLRK